MKHDFSTILAAASLKVTSPRTEILKVFYSRSKPIAAEDVQIFTKNRFDLATIYRTLGSFEKNGLIKRVDLRRDSQYYERADSRHHHHIVCSDCGRTEDFVDCDVDGLVRSALRKSSFQKVDTHSLELFGTCKNCAHAK